MNELKVYKIIKNIIFLKQKKNKDNIDEYFMLEIILKYELIKMNNELVYQKNKINELEINISLVFIM